MVSNRIQSRQRGVLMVEMVFGLGVLALVILPLAFSFFGETQLLHTLYHRAVAMEIVDGEMEVLAAGAWQELPPGTNSYEPRARSVTNLPPGRFTVMVGEARVRLEWQAEHRGRGGRVVREVKVQP